MRVFALRAGFDQHAFLRDINLAADYRMQPMGLGGLVKIDAAIHHAVVSDGHRIHAEFLDARHELVDAAGAVQKAVFCM